MADTVESAAAAMSEVRLDENGQPLSKNALKKVLKAEAAAKKKAEKAAAKVRSTVIVSTHINFMARCLIHVYLWPMLRLPTKLTTPLKRPQQQMMRILTRLNTKPNANSKSSTSRLLEEIPTPTNFM